MQKFASTAFSRYIGRLAKDPNSMEKIKDMVNRTSRDERFVSPYLAAASSIISEYPDTEKVRKAVGDIGNLSIRHGNNMEAGRVLPHSRTLQERYDKAPVAFWDRGKPKISKKEWATSELKNRLNGKGSDDTRYPLSRRQSAFKKQNKWLDNYDHENAINALPTYKTYAERMGIPKETLVDITHGGGYEHIQKFLKGEGRGYGLENVRDNITGLQVSPGLSEHTQAGERAHWYAAQSLSHYVGKPGILKAKVEAGKLLEAPNKYEAGLPYFHANDLKDVKLTQPEISDEMYGRMAGGTKQIRDAAIKKHKLDIR